MRIKILSFFLFFIFCSNSAVLLIAQNQNLGLQLNTEKAINGYVLFSPLRSVNTYLIDNCGKIVNVWACDNRPFYSAKLDENGNLVRMSGGWFNLDEYLELRDWNNNLLWKYTPPDSLGRFHSDFTLMPNGNIMLLSEEDVGVLEWIDIGGNPANIINNARLEKVIEIKPIFPDSAVIVWQWNQKDHLIQDYDATKLNYGIIGDHPRKLNVNLNNSIGSWQVVTHFNAVAYNQHLDLVMVSCWNCSELLVIDHSTSIEEAKSNIGGNYGFGGDFLYRIGNPQNFEKGDSSDRIFYGQHNPHWINDSLPFGNELLIFENGNGRPVDEYSRILILEQPDTALYSDFFNHEANYLIDSFLFEWNGLIAGDTFFTRFLGGVDMQNNGNLLINEAGDGTFFEINMQGEIVWHYQNPVGDSILLQGTIAPDLKADCYRALKYPPLFSGFDGLNLNGGAIIENENILSDSCILYENEYTFDTIMIDTTVIDTTRIDTTQNPIDTTVYLQNYLLEDLDIFPNPTKDYLYFKMHIGLFDKVEIKSAYGHTIAKYSEIESINCSEYNNGLYLVLFYKKEILVKVLKFIKY